MSKRHGYYYEEEIRKELFFLTREHDLWYHRLVDTHAFDQARRVARKLKLYNLAKFTMPRQPADWMTVYKGQIMFLECKSSKVKTSFNIKAAFQISKSGKYQLEQAGKIVKAGGIYWFLICRWVPYEMETFIVHPRKLKALLKKVIKQKKASIKWSILRKEATKVIKKGSISRPWDSMLLPLFKMK